MQSMIIRRFSSKRANTLIPFTKPESISFTASAPFKHDLFSDRITVFNRSSVLKRYAFHVLKPKYRPLDLQVTISRVLLRVLVNIQMRGAKHKCVFIEATERKLRIMKLKNIKLIFGLYCMNFHLLVLF